MNDNIINDSFYEHHVYTKDELETCALESNEYSPLERKLAKALLAERAEREAVQDVWKDAPEWACQTHRVWTDGNGSQKTSDLHTRTLPKTRAREIAEETAHTIIFSMSPVGENQIADTVEAGIKKYAVGEKNV